jgi:hypothetical protein
MITNDIIENDFKDFFNGAGRKKDYIGDLIIIKTRGLKNNLQIVDSASKFDLLVDQEYGIIKVIFRTSYYDEYKISIGNERGFDTLFIIGINRDKKIIEKVFAIPEKELTGKRHITITKSGKTYQKFKIDEKPYINTYNHIKTGKYSILEDNNITIM